MREVTVFRRIDESVGMIEWADRDNPTPEEITPIGATKIYHTIFPCCMLDHFRDMKQDQVTAILMRMIPR